MRYLLQFSYIGTRFRGFQKQYDKGVPVLVPTVQGALEDAFLNTKHKPLNIPKIYPSSRTDQGVHALCSAAHVDLEYKNPDAPVHRIISSLNSYFTKHDIDVRILSVRKVPEDFSARYSAVKKTYLYRFAVAKPEVLENFPVIRNVLPIPILEKDRCHFIRETSWDLEKFKEASKCFLGRHNFKTFSHKSHSKPDYDFNRHVESIEIKPGRPLLDCQESNYYDFYDITFSGKSFLYKQIRRMIGALNAVALGRINIPDITYMLENPDPESWNDRVVVWPGYGLYLLKVDYNESDLNIS